MHSTNNVEILALYKQQDALMSTLMELSNQMDDVVGTEEGKKMRENWESITNINETVTQCPAVQASYLEALDSLRSLKLEIDEKEKHEKHTEMTTLRLSIAFNTLMKMMGEEKQSVQSELSDLKIQVSELQKQVKTLNSFGCGDFAPYENNNADNILPESTKQIKATECFDERLSTEKPDLFELIGERETIDPIAPPGFDKFNRDMLSSRITLNTKPKEQKRPDDSIALKGRVNTLFSNSDMFDLKLNKNEFQSNMNIYKPVSGLIPPTQVPNVNQYINQYASL